MLWQEGKGARNSSFSLYVAGLFTGYYEYWDNDTRDRGGKCVEQSALALSALRAASKIASYVGEPTTATMWEALANRTAALMASTFWRPAQPQPQTRASVLAAHTLNTEGEITPRCAKSSTVYAL